MGSPDSTHIEAAVAQRPSQNYWNRLKTLVLVVAVGSIYFGQLTLLVGGGLLARSIAAVVGDPSLTAWPTAVLGILVAALGPPAAQIADFWGRKWLLVGFTACGCIGAIIVSRASSMGMAIAGFTIGGLSCVAQPLLHAVVSEVLPRKYRSWAQASVNVSVGLGAIYGLLAGGALTASNPEGFRIYFYISAGVYAASATACTLLYNPPQRETQIASFRAKLRQLDWVGYAMVASGVSLLCIGLSWAENPYPWKSSQVLGPFLVGVVILLGLIVYEWKFKKDGLFHHRLFIDRNFAIALVCIYVEGHCAFAANYFVPFQLSTVYPSMGSFRVGLCYAVSYFAFVVSALAAGLIIWKKRSVRYPSMTGFLGFLLFFALAATSKASTPEANFWGYMIFLGGGLGFLLTTLVVAAQFSTPPELIAITSGLVLSVRSLGASTGLVIYQAIFSAGISKNLVSKIAAATLPLGLPETSLVSLIGALTSGDPASLSKVPEATPEIIAAAEVALRKAYSIAFSHVWAAAASFTFLALAGSVFLREPKSEFTASIDAPLDIFEDKPENSAVDCSGTGKTNL
ncbi:uncharacterized protein Z519_00958 [Cladophialophora bantiana CBS 173.52]|uniref:Major facilitator superfamily (MFS) profile domain-containing protein n=1 Tax=Cladophialophora bantiana (strain ATCC 10958 / CBS 173.52 / CDC B-1940 / NIH 8579) TaxID=1442370 RepID=A0A0D2I7R9_CLAB1|nr:uncharacterized protein Z519_00958 [Cladophialophora bantiana CBS 173.52]KIW99295.1 hypothetical protein Z519_00958 [Cladophialophora bantiana CBS 173.52]